LEIRGGTSADYIEQRIREDVDRDFDEIRHIVNKVKAARKELATLQAPVLGGEA
jgi:hypothetical protein